MEWFGNRCRKIRYFISAMFVFSISIIDVRYSSSVYSVYLLQEGGVD